MKNFLWLWLTCTLTLMQGHARTHSEPFVATSVHMEGFHVHLGWVIPCLCVEICDEDECEWFLCSFFISPFQSSSLLFVFDRTIRGEGFIFWAPVGVCMPVFLCEDWNLTAVQGGRKENWRKEKEEYATVFKKYFIFHWIWVNASLKSFFQSFRSN